MTPEEIEGLRKLLATYPEEDRMIFSRAAAEFLRLHDAIECLYRMTPADVQREAEFLGVRSAILADEVEQIVRRFLQ
jgi:predicted transcriptional regulator